MSRLVICIPFLVFFALLYPRSEPPEEPESEPSPPPATVPVSPGQEVDPLPDADILAFLKKSLDRYDREVKGYTGTLEKRERVQGKLRPQEIVYFEFRQSPHSTYMKWLKGEEQAAAVVYVAGENGNKMLVRPAGLLALIPWQEDPAGPKAKKSARYTIDEFGIRRGLQRVYDSWTVRRAENNLHVEYEGVHTLGKLGNRPCYKIHRSQMPHPEDDGVLDVVLYFDKETWLQVGTELKGEGDKIIANYYFRDLVLNPEEIVRPGHFGRDLLNKK